MAGERLDPPTCDWAVEKTGKRVIDHWWQTETGWAICGNLMGIGPKPTKPGCSTLPIPGYYTTGDGGYIDEDGYVFIMGRTDDVINVAGHRLSTGEMEEVVAADPAIAECAVIGVNHPLKGQVPIGLVLLKDRVKTAEDVLENELVAMVRKSIGPIASFKHAIVVQRLPKTRSGKILCKTLRQIADGKAYIVPSTIDDPSSLAEIENIMTVQGLVTKETLNKSEIP